MGMLYSHFLDNVAPNYDWSVETGTEDADYPAANIADRIIVRPAKLTTVSGFWLGDAGSAQRVDWALIPMYNFQAALNVRLQFNATNSWGTPTMDAAVTIPAYRDDDLPVPVFVDLRQVTGYSAGGFRYVRFGTAGTNAAVLMVGEILLFSTARDLSPNINWGVQEPEEWFGHDNRTSTGHSNKVDLGTGGRKLQGVLDTTEAGLAAVRAWWRSCHGPFRSFGLVPDITINEGMVCEFIGPLDPTRNFLDNNHIGINIEEISRGVPL